MIPVFLKRAVHLCDNITGPAVSGLYLKQAHLSGQQSLLSRVRKLAPIESDCFHVSFFLSDQAH